MKIPKAKYTGKTENGRKVFELTEPYPYGKRTAPKGMLTDGTSCPIEWYVDPEDTKYWPASIPHDHQYAVQEMSRWSADWMFFRKLRKCGIRWTKSFVMWRAVRRFGGKYWKRGKRNPLTGGRV